MMGIDPMTQRPRMNESLDAIMKLFRSREPLTMETDWFTLHDARLQMANYSRPHLPVAAAASFTPTGPMAAGKHGIGLLSVAGANTRISSARGAGSKRQPRSRQAGIAR